ncbi:MAG TPA: hypothetical protein PLH48_15470, partial [Acinetobacter johnsonii]|nr:hypothetical protein [Acinetobacter johnsonii]
MLRRALYWLIMGLMLRCVWLGAFGISRQGYNAHVLPNARRTFTASSGCLRKSSTKPNLGSQENHDRILHQG